MALTSPCAWGDAAQADHVDRADGKLPRTLDEVEPQGPRKTGPILPQAEPVSWTRFDDRATRTARGMTRLWLRPWPLSLWNAAPRVMWLRSLVPWSSPSNTALSGKAGL